MCNKFDAHGALEDIKAKKKSPLHCSTAISITTSPNYGLELATFLERKKRYHPVLVWN